MELNRSGSPDISIAIVTYNNKDSIHACLNSIISATVNFKIQIILVDNNSPDDTASLLKQQGTGAQFCDYQVINNQQNRGFTAALNQALKKCTGRYIVVLNPDVILQEHTLSILIDKLEQDDKTGVTAPQLLNTDGTIQASCRYFPKKSDVLFEVLGLGLFSKKFKRWKMPDFDHSHSRYVDQPQGAFLVFSQDLLNKVGLWDERFFMFFSDVDWCYRVKKSGYEIFYCSGAKAIHFKGASVNKKRLPMIVSSHRSFVDYFFKYDKHLFQKSASCFIGFLLLIILLPRILIELCFKD